MGDCLSVEELVRLTGESQKRLLKWKAVGLLGRNCDEFTHEDIGRARLIHHLLHHGMKLEAMAAAARDENSVFCRYLQELSSRWPRSMYTVEQAAESTGLDIELVRRLMDAAGIREPGEVISGDDMGFFSACKVALDAGYPEDALIQVLRVYADAMERVAEAEGRMSHFYLHERMKSEGVTGEELLSRMEEAMGRLNPLVEPAILYFHRKGVARAVWEDMLTHLEEDSGLLQKPEAPGQIQRAIMFVDLANFTPLAEAMGDVAAANVLERFGTIVRVANARCHGRIVKQIGDAFMVVFPESFSAVSCALEIEDRASTEAQFPPVRAGLHWGTVLYRQGDYVGSNVNLASRLAADAGRHQVLITNEIWKRARDLPNAEFVRLGKRKLKGLAREVVVFEARMAGKSPSNRETDPVCGMELGPGEVAARLSWDSTDRAFCSDDCLKKFVREPEKYTL
jgi:class 3 adenylate cyclase